MANRIAYCTDCRQWNTEWSEEHTKCRHCASTSVVIYERGEQVSRPSTVADQQTAALAASLVALERDRREEEYYLGQDDDDEDDDGWECTKWIEVEDDLPDDDRVVACISHTEVIRTARYQHRSGQWVDSIYEDKELCCVHHWCDLPDLPQPKPGLTAEEQERIRLKMENHLSQGSQYQQVKQQAQLILAESNRIRTAKQQFTVKPNEDGKHSIASFKIIADGDNKDRTFKDVGCESLAIGIKRPVDGQWSMVAPWQPTPEVSKSTITAIDRVAEAIKHEEGIKRSWQPKQPGPRASAIREYAEAQVGLTNPNDLSPRSVASIMRLIQVIQREEAGEPYWQPQMASSDADDQC